MIFLQTVLTLLGLIAIDLNVIPLLLHPSFFMNESYYLAASQAVLNNDFFLTHYGFDKPYLLPFWPLLGILTFGTSAVGFRFVAFLCLQVSFFLLVSILKRISYSERSLGMHLLAVVFSIYFFSMPLMRTYLISSMTEPYIILGALLMIFVAVQKTKPSAALIANVFFPFLFTKYSMALCFPVFWTKENVGTPKKFFQWHLGIVKKGWPWFLALFVFSLTNATKFESILWFKHAGASRPGENIFTRTTDWVALFMQLFEQKWHLVFFAALFVSTVLILRKKKSQNLQWILVGSFLLHFVVVIFAGVGLFPRYTLILCPVFFTAAFFSLQHYFTKNLFFKGAVLVLICTAAVQEFKMPTSAVEPAVELGRTMSILQSDIDSANAMLFTNALWVTSPYRRNIKTFPCLNIECISETRRGAPVNAHQYFLDVKIGVKPVLRQLPLVFSGDEKLVRLQKSKSFYAFSSKDLKEKILSILKLNRAIADAELTLLPSAENDLKLLETKPLYFGPSFKLTGKIKDGNFQGGKPILVTGTFGVTDLKPNGTNVNSYRLVFKVDSAYLSEQDVTDYFPIFFNGYSFVLGSFDAIWSDHKMFESLSYNEVAQAFEGTLVRAEEKL